MARRRSESARSAVLEAMRTMLPRDGYDAVTIEGLAAEAGISKQTIYRWWPGKADILGEALLDGALPGVDTALPVTDDVGADLRSWLLGSSDHLTGAANATLARALIAVTATNPTLGTALNERFASRVTQTVADRLRLAQRDGSVREDVDVDAIAELFLATSSYAALTGRTQSPEAASAVVDALVHGISAR